MRKAIAASFVVCMLGNQTLVAQDVTPSDTIRANRTTYSPIMDVLGKARSAVVVTDEQHNASCCEARSIVFGTFIRSSLVNFSRSTSGDEPRSRQRNRSDETVLGQIDD